MGESNEDIENWDSLDCGGNFGTRDGIYAHERGTIGNYVGHWIFIFNDCNCGD